MGKGEGSSLINWTDEFYEIGRLTYLYGEEGLVVELVLHPRHQVVDVLWRRALDWLFHRLAVRPMVFILGAGRHDGAPLLRAELCDGAVQHVYLVEEVDRVDRYPLVQVFSLG